MPFRNENQDPKLIILFIMADKKGQKADELQNVEEALNKTEAFIEKYQNQLLIGLTIVVLVVVGVLGINNWYLEPREKSAADAMVTAQLYFERDSFNLALNGDGLNDGLLDIIDSYGSTKSGKLARFYAGVSYYHLGEYQEAIDYLKKVNIKSVNLTPVSQGLLGDCYVQLGETETAVKFFEKAASSKNEVIAPIYLHKAGVAYQSLKNYKKAIEAYTQIKDLYPTSQQAAGAEKAIIRCEYLSK